MMTPQYEARLQEIENSGIHISDQFPLLIEAAVAECLRKMTDEDLASKFGLQRIKP